MLEHVRIHEEYLGFMLPRIRKLFLEKPGQVLLYLDAALKAYVLNLDRGIEILQGCYSKDFGRPADFDPADMLRSLVLMVSLGITSITKWANNLANCDVLAVLSGFVPGKTPSVGAFYDFWNKLWLEDKRLRRERKRKLKKKRKKPKDAKKSQKLHNRRPGVVDRLLRSFRKGRFFPPSAPSGCCRSCSLGRLYWAPGIEILSLLIWYWPVTAPLLNPAVTLLVSRCAIAETRETPGATAPEDTVMFMLTGATIAPAMYTSGEEICIRFPVLTVKLNCRYFFVSDRAPGTIVCFLRLVWWKHGPFLLRPGLRSAFSSVIRPTMRTLYIPCWMITAPSRLSN